MLTKATKHDLKFGYEFRRTTIDQFFDAGYRGRLDFGSLEDFLSGTLSGGRAARGNSNRFTFQNSHAGYLQDTFRYSPQLTFNLGLRWDYFGVIDERDHLLSNFDPTAGLVQVGSPGLPRLYNRDWNNFSPRIGLAWNVSGNDKTVVRAGWGLYYDAFSQDFFAGQLPFNTFNPGPAFNPVGPAPVLFSFSTEPVIQEGVPIFTDFLDSELRIQFRAEIFNIFNHPNFSNPLLPSFAADMTASVDPVTGRGTGFLPITVTPDVGIGNPFMGGGGPRNIQLAMKLIF